MRRNMLLLLVLVVVVSAVGARGTGGGAGEKVELTIATHWIGADPRAPVLDRVWERVEAANPNVSITIQPVEGDGSEASLAWIASGDVPDVFEFGTQDLGRFYRAGLLMDLTEEVNSDSAWKARFLPGVLQAGMLDGKVLTIPNSFYYAPFYANKELFEAHGLKLPETYDDLIAAQKVFNKDPDVMGYMPFQKWPAMAAFLALAASNGAADAYRAAGLKGTASWNQPGIRDALQKVRAIYGIVQDNPYETSHDTAFSFFTTGKSALYLNGTWAIGQMAEGPEGEAFFDKVAVIPFPYTKLPNCMANGVDYGWSADSDATGAKADAAIAVLKELCSLETTQDTIYSARVLIGMDVGNVDRDRIGILADLLDVLPQMPAESVDLNIWPALSDPTIYQEFTATIFDYIEGKMTLDEAISKLDSITLGKIK